MGETIWNWGWNKAVKSVFDWKEVSGYNFSEQSRNNNKQKLWLRPTIPWRLSCDRDVLSRSDAADVFAMRLDHLGFMEYIIVLSVIITLTVAIPFTILCCGSRGSFTGSNHASAWPYIARALFVGTFLVMLHLINEERVQCKNNQAKIAKFEKTNNCGDDYSKIDTLAVSA